MTDQEEQPIQDSIVWILGAGFSKSLGGHLLPVLLSEKAKAEVSAKYDYFGHLTGEHEEVYYLYRQGHSENKHPDAWKLWEHAEEFLEYLDHAAEGIQPKMEVLARLSLSLWPNESKDFTRWRAAAKRLVAFECAFTADADLEDEVWQPYLRWARLLQRNDRIVTFNYDLVPELLGDAPNVDLEIALKPHVEPPKLDTAALISGNFPKTTPVYKLHGSIDWELVDGKLTRSNPPFAVLNKPDCPVVMATPGRTKRTTCKGVLNHIWTRALQVISEATAVVFVGYRFPPSDAESRERLLGALSRRKGDRQLRYIHTVLGPRINEDDTVRLQSLLRDTMLGTGWAEIKDSPSKHDTHSFKVTVHPLLAEDYFTVFNRLRILRGT